MTGSYIKTSTAVIAALYVLFAGVVVIAAVLDALTTDQMWDWLAKGGLVAAIGAAVNAAVGGLSLLISKR